MPGSALANRVRFLENRTAALCTRRRAVGGDTIRGKPMQKKRPKPTPERSSQLQFPPEPQEPSASSEQLWVRPESNLRQGRGTAAEENISPATAERLLKLADIALGVKKSVPKPKLLSVQAHHQKVSQRKKKIRTQSN